MSKETDNNVESEEDCAPLWEWVGVKPPDDDEDDDSPISTTNSNKQADQYTISNPLVQTQQC